jgi:GNAT superfamily N-acetyltransferase
MSNSLTCEWCGATIEGVDLDSFSDAFLAHVRSAHAEFPYPDHMVRNYAEATQRLSDPEPRVDALGAVTIEPVTEQRVDDWLAFFDHDAFSGNPAWASCYCLEPHVTDPKVPLDQQPAHTARDRREAMRDLLRRGKSFGYLAYVDGRPAAWVNASARSEYALFRRGKGAEPPDDDVIGIACFVVSPPYRKHGLARRLLERVLADAPARGAAWVEAYPGNEARADDAGNFRGPRAMYEAHGFTAVKVRERDTVMRRRA